MTHEGDFRPQRLYVLYGADRLTDRWRVAHEVPYRRCPCCGKARSRSCHSRFHRYYASEARRLDGGAFVTTGRVVQWGYAADCWGCGFAVRIPCDPEQPRDLAYQQRATAALWNRVLPPGDYPMAYRE
jgi:hypothetical protein